MTLPDISLREHLARTIAACAAIFWGPDEESCVKLVSLDFPALAGDCPAALPELARTMRDLADFATLMNQNGRFCKDLENAYVSLFVSSLGGAAAPPFQSCYMPGPSSLMGPPALAMSERLADEGLAASLAPGEPNDHLCIELEYLYYLLTRTGPEADAKWGKGAAFAFHDMLPWTRRFREVLSSAQGAGRFFYLAAKLLTAVLSAFGPYCERPS